jgi:import inner membrane translocase subunit TIM23|tara:strand:+ start:95 stop:577 length:483 start_codon:yes stop_codon:yes gene_type:complete
MSSKEKEEDRFRIPDVSRIDLNRIARQPQTQPDYVPYNQKGRDPLDGATHKLGFFWLAGFGSGGAYGFVEGWKKAASPAFKIRMNSVLNSVSSRGTRIGNMLGVVAGFHTMFSGGIEYTTALSERTSTEWLTPALAGGLTGGLYVIEYSLIFNRHTISLY